MRRFVWNGREVQSIAQKKPKLAVLEIITVLFVFIDRETIFVSSESWICPPILMRLDLVHGGKSFDQYLFYPLAYV